MSSRGKSRFTVDLNRDDYSDDDLQEPCLPQELSRWTDCHSDEKELSESTASIQPDEHTSHDESYGPALPPGFSASHSDSERIVSIGPALPRRFTSRSNESSRDTGPDLPAVMGPVLPDHLRGKSSEQGSQIGLCVPPHESRNKSEKQIDAFGPVLPPGLRKQTSGNENVIGPEIRPGLNHNPADIIGPALPPRLRPGSDKPADVVGPFLPPGLRPESDKPADIIGPALPPRLRPGSDKPADVVGPSLPPGLRPGSDKPAEVIGPALPPGFTAPENSDSYGPALPPGYRAAEESDSYGPVLPPGFEASPFSEPLTSRTHGDSDSDSEEEMMGPMPYAGPSMDATAAEEFEMRAKKMKDKLSGKNDTEVVTRESWMTELPTEMKGFGLGPRKFRANPAADGGDRSVWTDTPADRARKEKEGESGSKRKHEEAIYSERDQRLSAQISEYNKTKRGESLMDMHTKALKKKKESEPEKPYQRRPFDREADLQTNRFDDAQRKSIIKKSQNLDSRFSHGSSQYI